MLIREVCKKTKLSSSTIRYYEKQGLLNSVKRGDNNYRVFDEDDVQRLIFIKKAKSLGFTLEEIKTILELKENDKQPCNFVNERIKNKIAFIEEQIAALKQEKEKLENFLSEFKKLERKDGYICPCIEKQDI